MAADEVRWQRSRSLLPLFPSSQENDDLAFVELCSQFNGVDLDVFLAENTRIADRLAALAMDRLKMPDV